MSATSPPPASWADLVVGVDQPPIHADKIIIADTMDTPGPGGRRLDAVWIVVQVWRTLRMDVVLYTRWQNREELELGETIFAEIVGQVCLGVAGVRDTQVLWKEETGDWGFDGRRLHLIVRVSDGHHLEPAINFLDRFSTSWTTRRIES